MNHLKAFGYCCLARKYVTADCLDIKDPRANGGDVSNESLSDEAAERPY